MTVVNLFNIQETRGEMGLAGRLLYMMKDELEQYELHRSENVSMQYLQQPLENRRVFVSELPRCDICGDKSIGKQYGAYTCDGCKCFFRRSVRSGSSYICKSNGACIITIATRSQCRYCRMMKCLEVGMRIEAVQGGIKKAIEGKDIGATKNPCL